MSEQRWNIAPFVELGRRIERALGEEGLRATMRLAQTSNSWFTEDSIRQAFHAIATQMLTQEALETWLAPYAGGTKKSLTSLRVGVIAAGNIPLVGFFDLLCVLVCGHTCLLKTSSKDSVLMEWVVSQLKEIDPEIPIQMWGGELDPTQPEINPQALIATGSDNTNRYFRHRFGAIPTLLRGSRTSVAVLDGTQSSAEIKKLVHDLFDHNSLGCRSVSHLLLPTGYDPRRLMRALRLHHQSHPKYQNAYLQARALHTLQQRPFIDGDTFLLRAATLSETTLGEIGYSFYANPSAAQSWIQENDSQIQCVVAPTWITHPRRTAPGKAQYPRLCDYPDGVDTFEFLCNL